MIQHTCESLFLYNNVSLIKLIRRSIINEIRERVPFLRTYTSKITIYFILFYNMNTIRFEHKSFIQRQKIELVN